MYFQVFIFYGPRSNAELLMHSGFVCDDNAHDRLAVRMGQWTAAITSWHLSCDSFLCQYLYADVVAPDQAIDGTLSMLSWWDLADSILSILLCLRK